MFSTRERDTRSFASEKRERERDSLTLKRREISPDELEGYREAFYLFDKDHNGHIDLEELSEVMRSVGMDPTEDELKNMISKVDADNTGTIDYDEFIQMMSELSLSESTRIASQEEAFEALDCDKNKYITAADLIAVAKGLGEELSGDDALEMIREGDSDGDGLVSFEDFCKLMRQMNE